MYHVENFSIGPGMDTSLLESSSAQVLLGLHHADVHGRQPDHHPGWHHLLQRRDDNTLDHLQRGLGHLLPHGPGAQLQDGHRVRRQHRDHPGSQEDQEEVPEELVYRGLCFLHTCGLYLPHCGEGHRLGGVQNGPGVAHRSVHEDPQPAAPPQAVQTHPLHPPVGGGTQIFMFCPLSKGKGRWFGTHHQ